MFKKIILLSLFIIFCKMMHAQQADWMIGTWKSRSTSATPSYNITRTLQINDVGGESFTGTKTSKINNTTITISISGAFRGKGMYLQDGEAIDKASQSGQGFDCSSCTQSNKIIISRDSLMLIDSISACDNRCNGVTFYYRLLSDYEDDTQRYLVDRFGRPADIIGFRPYGVPQDKPVASADDTSKNTAVVDEKRLRQDSLDNIARIKQEQAGNAARIAEQKKRQKEISDSLNLVQQKEKLRLKDSLNNAARLEKIRLRTEDSLRNMQAKQRQQQVKDSINLAQQNKQQHIKDSLDNVAKLKQQQINDAALLAQQKKRQQEITDSLNLVQKREQQRLKDSLDNVARLEQIRLRTEDSLRNTQAKKRQQEVADSLSLANQKEQQRIKDSLQTVAADNLQKQRTADSLRDVQAKIKQQEISDSLEIIRKQQYNDSLAAIRKQQYNDSLQKAALAKAVPPPVKQPDADKALTTRTSVLLQTYHIDSPDILIELFDNGEIDGDRVSVYHNNALIVSNQTLGIKPITLNVHADATNREHEFVLIAENLGSIPPNSALMRITAGKQSYKLSVNTDLKTNARIVFYYDGK